MTAVGTSVGLAAGAAVAGLLVQSVPHPDTNVCSVLTRVFLPFTDGDGKVSAARKLIPAASASPRSSCVRGAGGTRTASTSPRSAASSP
ncbi:hypothetical protein [Streptomyces sp. NPDC058695]|uniref:hypothetical protein n=1 Tax=Streptomyces sp. NPDC058695 TaxID=3346604 RepID=UPI003652999E